MGLKIDRLQLEIVINNDQARRQLRALDEEAKLLTKEMKRLDQTSEDYARKADRLKAIKLQMDQIYESIGITNMTMKELVNRQKELNMILNHLRPGTEEYKKLKSEIDAVSNRIGELKGRAKDTGTALNKSLGGGSILQSLKLGYFAVAGAITATYTSVKRLYEAYQEQERADKRLLFALRGNIDAYQQLKQQSDDLQTATGIPDEVINQIQMLGIESGKSTELVKKITHAAIELASMTGIDLQTAFLQLNRTLTGVVGKTLPALSVDFKNLTKEQLKNGDAIDLVLKKYSGMAEKSATATDTLTVSWNEFQESLGKSESGPFAWVLRKLAEMLNILKTVNEVFFQFGGDRDVWDAHKEGINTTTDAVNRFTKQMEIAQKNPAQWKKIAKSGLKELDDDLKKQQSDLAGIEARRKAYQNLTLEQANSLGVTDAEIKRLKVLEETQKTSINTIRSKISVLNTMLYGDKPIPEIDDDAESAASKAAKKAEEAYKADIAIKQKQIESEIAIMQEGYKKELYTLHAAYAQQREETMHELETNKKLKTEQKELLNETLLNLDKKYVDDVEKLQKDERIKQLSFDKELIDLKIAGVKQGSYEEYQLHKQLLDNTKQLEIENAKGSEEQKQQLISAINSKYAKLQADEDEKYTLKLLDTKLKQDITALNNTEQQKEEALKQKRATGKLSQKAYLKQLFDIQNNYTQESLKLSIEKAQRELDILKASGEDVTQAEATLAELRLKAQEAGMGKSVVKGTGWKDWTTTDRLNAAVDAAKMIADAEFQISADKNQRELDDKLKFLDDQRNAELSNKNLTENQKDAINNKYNAKERSLRKAAWEKQHKADIAQAWVNLALMIGKAGINTWPIPAIPLMGMAAIEGGLQVAAVTSQKVPEYSKGRYTVTGMSGEVYNDVDYTGPAVTGIYTRPALISEKGSELIIDAPTTRNLQMNYPEIIAAIMAARVPQYAAGRYTTVTAPAPVAAASQSNTSMVDAMNRFADAVERLEKNGIKGNWIYKDFIDFDDKVKETESRTGL